MSRLQKSRWLLPLACLAAVLLLVSSELTYRSGRQTLNELGGYNTIRMHVYRMLQLCIDAETAERGYLLTANVHYLEPYNAAQRELDGTRVALREALAVRGSAAERDGGAALDRLVQARMATVQEIVQQFQQGRHDAALTLMRSGIGREQMDDIRQAAQELLERVALDVRDGRAELRETLQLNRYAVAAMAVLSMLAVLMLLTRNAQMSEQALAIEQESLGENERLSAAVAKRTRQLAELASHLQTAREDERRHLARELHDELGALLTAAKLDAARIKVRLKEHAPELLDRLAQLGDTLGQGIALKRRIIEDLHPSSLTNLGFYPALETLLREWSEASGLPLHTDLTPGVSLTPRAQLTVYRMVQEALTNIGKYAEATQVHVQLAREGDQAVVRVADNGRGFDPSQLTLTTHGLLGMRHRLASEGGHLAVDSAPGRGTQLTARLPMLGAG